MRLAVLTGERYGEVWRGVESCAPKEGEWGWPCSLGRGMERYGEVCT